MESYFYFYLWRNLTIAMDFFPIFPSVSVRSLEENNFHIHLKNVW